MFGVKLPEKINKKDFKILPENIDAISLFLRVQTQFRIGFGGVTGLDYAAVIQVANMYSYNKLPFLFEKLQIMEIKALELINKEGKNNG